MTTAPLTLTPKTTIHTLLKEYPFLLDFLADYHPEFKKLTNPVLRRTVGRMATLDTVAEQGNVPLNRLTDDIATEVEKRTGTRPPVADVADVETIDPARLAELHAIVKDLHAGKTVEEVKPRFEELIAGRRGHRDRRHGAEAHRGRRPRQRGQAPLRRARAGVRRRARGPRGGHGAGRAPDRHVPAREPGAAAGHGVAAQGRRGHRRAAGRRRVGPPQGRPGRHRGAALRGRQALPAQGEPALPLPRGPRRGRSEQGDVGDPRRHPRARQAGAGHDRRGRRGDGREHLPRARQDGRRHGDQGGEGPASHGDRHA